MENLLTVKQLNLYVRSLLDGDSRLAFLSVCGEISNFKNHYSSGHLYFSLKDSDAVIRCVMFKTNAFSLKFSPKDGDKVVCTGRVSLYEKDGQYQLYVESMKPSGTGDAAEQFRIVKEKLEKEGLFDSQTKRKPPLFPSCIALITSDTGAALQDMLNIISRRYPIGSVMIVPSLVQGEKAAVSLINSLEEVYESQKADVIIIGRGGGSAEDLSAFNDEALARKIYESPVPVISAVGHETDFTICDFVADLRAPTPSAAAEIAVPDLSETAKQVSMLSRRISNAALNRIDRAYLAVGRAEMSRCFSDPYYIVEERQIAADKLGDRMNSALKAKIIKSENDFLRLSSELEAYSPLKVLARGYAAVSSGGQTVKTVSQIKKGDTVKLTLSDGTASALITDIDRAGELYGK